MKLGPTLLIATGAGLLIYAGFTGTDPRSIVQDVLTGSGRKPLPGIDKSGSGSASGGTSGSPDKATGGGSGGSGGGTGCKEPTNLVTRDGVTLSKPAMAALTRAEARVGRKISISSSYRSCADQQRACNDICGGGCNGCPGRCAPCGQSYHQKGNAIDLSASACKDAAINRALAAEGWCAPASLRTSDPCHRSYGGCG